MHNNHHSVLPELWQRSCKWIIPLCWILGLFLGILAAAGAGDSFSLMMRGANDFTVSILGLLLVTVLPFLLTAFAVFLSQPGFFLFLVLAKAYSFGFCAFGIMTVYADSSWLVRFLLMFSDGCALPLLMWLWLRYGSLSGKPGSRDFAVCTAAALTLGVLDICVVSPFAAMLL